jgi:hypothetical protein
VPGVLVLRVAPAVTLPLGNTERFSPPSGRVPGRKNLPILSLMALRSRAKGGSLSTRVDRCLNPRKEHPVELNIVNEVAALQRLCPPFRNVGRLKD